MHSRALIVIPPFLGYTAGPLLGPALLAGAGRAAGHEVTVLDLNVRYLRRSIPRPDNASRPREQLFIIGDHDKPGTRIKDAQRAFSSRVQALLPVPLSTVDGEDPILTLTFGHEQVEAAARALLRTEEGRWLYKHLEGRLTPHLFGVSVLYSGQVLWGLAASYAARELWPDTLIVWGGPHVTALKPAIEQDHGYSSTIDHFVFGHAERTFVEMLSARWSSRKRLSSSPLSHRSRMVEGVEEAEQTPRFDDLALYGDPTLTLPSQLSRGCPYGRCRFCTYPAVGGEYRTLGFAALEGAVALARKHGAVLSFKDSLLTPQRLETVARRLRGEVAWSACTKLHRSLTSTTLTYLAESGCRTLELGVETMCPRTQKLIDKQQSRDLFLRVLDSATGSGLALVINYIVGFPGELEEDAAAWLDWVKREVVARRPQLVAVMELNTFQLERRSRFGREPDRYGITVTGSWPWASVLRWECKRKRENDVRQTQYVATVANSDRMRVIQVENLSGRSVAESGRLS